MRKQHSQKGAILVISLLLLLILTVLGLAVMRMTRMQERMAGNTRDLNLAMQGAEAGLRDGENRILALRARPLDVGTAPCGVAADTILTASVCQNDVLPVGMAFRDNAWWLANARPFGDQFTTGGAQDFNELAADPRYTIEWIGTSRENQGLQIGQEVPDPVFFYQVTARSTGAPPGNANTVLQSTFAKVY